MFGSYNPLHENCHLPAPVTWGILMRSTYLIVLNNCFGKACAPNFPFTGLYRGVFFLAGVIRPRLAIADGAPDLRIFVNSFFGTPRGRTGSFTDCSLCNFWIFCRTLVQSRGRGLGNTRFTVTVHISSPFSPYIVLRTFYINSVGPFARGQLFRKRYRSRYRFTFKNSFLLLRFFILRSRGCYILIPDTVVIDLYQRSNGCP